MFFFLICLLSRLLVFSAFLPFQLMAGFVCTLYKHSHIRFVRLQVRYRITYNRVMFIQIMARNKVRKKMHMNDSNLFAVRQFQSHALFSPNISLCDKNSYAKFFGFLFHLSHELDVPGVNERYIKHRTVSSRICSAIADWNVPI